MGEIHRLPGVSATVIPGIPRTDIAESLRNLADLAERGEIESVVLIAIGPTCGIFDLVSTPELNFYEMLGAIEALKPVIMERCMATRVRSHVERDPAEPD